MTHRLSRTTALIAIALLACTMLFFVSPGTAHADAFRPLQLIPTWLQEAIDTLERALVMTLQDTARVGGVLLWGVLKVCGLVGLFGADFTTLFGTVVTEALNAVITGSVHDLIRGSLMVSLGLFGLSLLARPFWPDLKLVSFQRAAIWGIAIQAYLLNAPGIYTELETWRVNLSEEVASAVSTGAIPGCTGDVVEVLLCITGTSTAEVLDPNLTVLPDGIPYGGTESVRDLYDHCVNNPAVLYGDPACDPDNPVGDPWEVLAYAQDALAIQLLGLVIALLILTYGVLQISLGLSAGMMFVLFPVAAMFAFYLPLESFPAGVIRNYIQIFLKSVVLLTLAAVVIRLFSVSTGSLAAMAAVALVDLVLCLVMAKEALATLLGSVSFIGASVGALGSAVGLTGGGGGAPLPSPESRLAASMIGGGAVTQTVMGAPHPYGGAQGTTLLGSAGNALGAPGRSARAALSAAVAAGTGGVGAVAGALAATQGTDYGSLALMGNAATTVLGRSAGRGFVTGAGLAATRQLLTGGESGVDSAARPSGSAPPPPAQSSLLVPVPPGASPSPATRPSASAAATRPTLAPADATSGMPASAAPLQGLLLGDPTTSLSGWAPSSAAQIQHAATKLTPASPDAENAAFDLARAGHQQAHEWEQDGRSPVLSDGSIDAQFVEEVVEREPAAAAALVTEQAAAHIPPEERLSIGEAVALGVTAQRTLPVRQVRQGLARAVKAMGQAGDLGAVLETELGVGPQVLFGERAEQVEQVAGQMQQAGLANELGRQLVETVGESLERNPRLTVQQFREGGSPARLARMRQWDRATGDPETTDRIVDRLIGLGSPGLATVYEVPRPPATTPGHTAGTATPATPDGSPSSETTSTASPPADTASASVPAQTADTPVPPASPIPPESPAATPSTSGAPAPTVQATPVPGPASGGQVDPALVERLRTWRLETAQQTGQKAFYVFPDATLQRIAAARPQTLEELQSVKGVGPKKLDDYGQAVLDITRQEAAQSAPEGAGAQEAAKEQET